MKDVIEFDDFMKLDMRVGTVTEVTKMENSDKLLKIQVDLGEAKRQVVSGMAEFYTPEELVGKQIIVLMNLEQRKLRGEISEGMLLAADEDGKAVVLTVDRPVGNGTLVR